MDSNPLTLITSFFSSLWDLFTDVQVPLLGISFASLWIGVFIVAFSITLLRPVLGIGAGALNTLSKGISRAGRSISRSNFKGGNDD